MIKHGWRRIWLVGMGTIFVLSVFSLGWSAGRQAEGTFLSLPSATSPVISGINGVDKNLFSQVWGILHEKYYQRDQVNDKDLFYGAVVGLAASLEDPYTVFLDPKTAQKFSQDLSGEFEGIGAEIGIKNDRLTIVAPLPESPAERAGLRAGDIIWAIDKVDTTNITLEKAVSLIRGPAVTTVVLAITREGFRAIKDISVKRERIQVKSVTWKILSESSRGAGALGYIKLAQFNEDTVPLFEQAARELLEKRVRGLILDVRNNPGGLLESAVSVASLWIPEGAVVKEKFVGEVERAHARDGLLLLADMPTVVLVNRGSASASEIVAGALQDYGKAKLVGEKTFGKGSVQELQTFPDGSALKVTVATWYTPKGRQINEFGIKPDVEVEMKPEDYDKNRDPQLERAIQILNKK